MSPSPKTKSTASCIGHQADLGDGNVFVLVGHHWIGKFSFVEYSSPSYRLLLTTQLGDQASPSAANARRASSAFFGSAFPWAKKDGKEVKDSHEDVPKLCEVNSIILGILSHKKKKIRMETLWKHPHHALHITSPASSIIPLLPNCSC